MLWLHVLVGTETSVLFFYVKVKIENVSSVLDKFAERLTTGPDGVLSVLLKKTRSSS